MENFIKVLAGTVAVMILGAVGIFLAEQGLQRHERAECLQWQKEAQSIDNYYLTDWQKEQCETVGVDIIFKNNK